MRDNPKPFEVYRHFKGKDYKVLCIAKDSDSDPEYLKEVVVYEALYGRGYR